MASKNGFEPDEVREIAKNFPDVKKLMIEREQIKQDAKNSPTHTKLDPHPKPKGDIHHPKIHKEKDGEKTARENHYDNELKSNSKEMETAFHDNFEKADLKIMSDWAKEMDTDELTIFMEEGYDKVLEEREQTKEIDVEQSMKLSAEKRDAIMERGSSIDIDDSSKDMDVDRGNLEREPSDFETNSKDITVDKDKTPSPADDFE